MSIGFLRVGIGQLQAINAIAFLCIIVDSSKLDILRKHYELDIRSSMNAPTFMISSSRLISS